jgi:hypothetical protein
MSGEVSEQGGILTAKIQLLETALLDHFYRIKFGGQFAKRGFNGDFRNAD